MDVIHMTAGAMLSAQIYLVKHHLQNLVTGHTNITVQGDNFAQQQPPVDLDLGCSAILHGAVGSYSSGPAAAGTLGTKSTGGCYRPDVSQCTFACRAS